MTPDRSERRGQTDGGWKDKGASEYDRGREERYLYSDLAILCPVTANKLTSHSSASSLKPRQGAKQPPLTSVDGQLRNKHCCLLYGCMLVPPCPCSV